VRKVFASLAAGALMVIMVVGPASAQGHKEVGIPDGNGNPNGTTMVCHKQEGASLKLQEEWFVINIPVKALKAHEDHGDFEINTESECETE
jgi:hypothetical protein